MDRICSFDKCEKIIYAKKLCKAHHEQQRLGKALKPLRDRSPSGTWSHLTECTAEGCHKEPRAKGLCGGHLWQVQKSISRTLKPKRIFQPGEWGPWYKDGNGYVTRTKYMGDKKSVRQFQHRFVMEEYLGRELLPKENIHHRNGDRAQNNIENLEIWITPQPKGIRIPDAVEWAKKTLALYEPSALSAKLD